MKIPIARWISSSFRGLLKILIVLATVFVVYFAYSLYREKIAKADAIKFCDTVKVGDPTDGILERARLSGAEEFELKWYSRTDGSRILSVTYVGAPPFSRYSCWIEATSKVTSASYSHMD